MTNRAIVEKEVANISVALTEFYEATGFKLDKLTSNIVPLDELVDSICPLTIIEVEKLTYKRVSEIINARTMRPITLPRDDDKPLSGFLYAELVRGCILVNKSDPIVRRRFSVAHELGHYILHFLPLVDEVNIKEELEQMVLYEGLVKTEVSGDERTLTGELTFTRVPGRQITANDITQMEKEADQFAAELLVPAPLCKKLVKQFILRFGRQREVLVRRLATEFLVSKSMMRRRLDDLNLP